MEAVVGLLLLAFVVQLTWALLSRQISVARAAADRIELLEARRTVRWILEEELRASQKGWAWQLHSGDSLSLRAFRGSGLVCPPGSGREVLVAGYSGIRSPNPEKDSVQALGSGGMWQTFKLDDRVRLDGSCPVAPNLDLERWVLSDSAAGIVLARIFESGSYHLSDGVLRYRRGEGGRQPLTPAGPFRESGLSATESGLGWILRSELVGHPPEVVEWKGALRTLDGGS
jgi:hypothetical protein